MADEPAPPVAPDNRPAAAGPIQNSGRSQFRNFLWTFHISTDRATAMFLYEGHSHFTEALWEEEINRYTRHGTHWKIKAMSLQLELSASGRYHYQGFIQLKKKHRLSAVINVFRRVFGAGVHVEPAHHPADAFRYCQKEDTRVQGTEPMVFGEVITQGHRSDLEMIHAEAVSGSSLLEIMEKHPIALRYSNGINKLVEMIASRDIQERETFVFVFYGPSGTGKSSAARRLLNAFRKDNEQIYIADSDSSKWWDHLGPNGLVLIDDYTAGYNYSFLMRLLDRYPVRMEGKGVVFNRRPRVIVITSILHPREWYGATRYTDGLERRVNDGQLISTEAWPVKVPGTVNWDPAAACPMAPCPECCLFVDRPHDCPSRPRPARRIVLDDTIEFSDTDLDDAQGSDSEVASTVSVHSNLLAHIDAHPEDGE